MSSLRLALKQSLQESGGGTFSSAHGEKKKRKKKKSQLANGNGNSNGKKGRDSKRKRGRPRKRDHLEDDDDDEEVRNRKQKENTNDDEDEEGFYSENEFSYNGEDYSGDDDGSGEEVDDDDSEDGDGLYQSRSRAPLDDEGEEGMHSEEDDPQPKGSSQSKTNHAEKPPKAPSHETNEQNSNEAPPQIDADVDAHPTVTSDPSSNANAEAEEAMRKKLKLLKLMKKLEKNQNQNSAASKIQTQWKKKKVTPVSSSESKEHAPSSAGVATSTASTTTTSATGIEKEETPQSKGLTESASPKANPGTSTSLLKLVAAVEEQQKQNAPGSAKSTNGGGDTISETTASNNKDVPAATSCTKPLPSTSSATAGDRGNTKTEGEEAPPVKRHGYVPAPTREVKQWTASMSAKKSRKHIRVGMRVKVRFAIPVKRDGIKVTRKKFYGGKVTAISKKCNKIRIKYDDGTSEVSKFPDQDVYVDAVDNGEHSVPADKFIPPSQQELQQVQASETVEEPEEGEISTPKSAPAPTVVADAAAPVPMETEEGEVNEEDTRPKAGPLELLDPMEISKAPLGENTTTTVPAKTAPSEKRMGVPSTPPSGSLPTVPLPKNETADAAATATAAESSKGNIQMEPAPSPSHEEGELSPGATVSKNDEEQQDETTTLLASAAESNSLPPETPLPTHFGSEKATPDPIKFAAPDIAVESTGDASIPVDKSSNNKPVAEADLPPSKPKKLSIRIPSNSLASIKALSSPKSASDTKSPMPPTSSNIAAADATIKADDVLKDTPETKMEGTQKRKRTDDATNVNAVAPSIDAAASGQEPLAKRRMKVAIGKNLIQAANASAAATAASSMKSETNESKVQSSSEMVVEEQELAPIAEEPMSISAGETKKKKKKKDRVKSPRPKSPLLIPEPEKIKSKSNSDSAEASGAVTPKQQKIGSKGSAFSVKKSSSKDDIAVTGQKEIGSVELTSAFVSLRTGRKAAEEAKEKLSVKQKAKLVAKESKEKEVTPPESGKKKKKRRREKEAAEYGEESEEVEQSELEWVQCDSCKKWRVLPDNVKASSLLDVWYCHMNIYDPKRNTCAAPEQTDKQLLRERKKKARKRQRREAELAAEAQQEKSLKKSKKHEEETVATIKKKIKPEKLQAGASTPRSTSPKPTKSAKPLGGKSKESAAETKKAIAEAKKANLEGGKKSKGVVEDKANPTDSGSDTPKEVKKKGKKGKKESQDSSDKQDVDDPKKGGRKRGRPSNNQTVCTPAPTSSANRGDEDEDNVEWVQCDQCQKWRKLPPHISADELPDVWNCKMNTWNPSAASCDVAEDKADAHHQEVGTTEWQLRQNHAGKYSYRQMIFGTGARKHNRPISERSRAAESLFIQPVNNDEQSYPVTQYTKSSAFLPRLTNFDKRNAIEENTIGIFDVLRHSNLWEDLRTMDMTPPKVLSSSTSSLNIPGQKLKTYDCLSDEIKHAMQDVVLQTLEFGCLTGVEITGKAQWFPFETSIKGVAGIRGYCNEDIIIHTLLDLVRDGLVEMATVQNPFCPVSQWVPSYRRVGTRRAIEAVEAIKASRCMKIAKPWKHRPSKSTAATEWVTGQNVN